MTREFAIVWAHKDRLLEGFSNTVWLSVLATVLALAIAGPITIALMARSPVLRAAARALVDGMRCVPFLLLAYIIYYGLPTLGVRFDNWTSGLCALVIYNAAYMAEILRGAWASLPREQYRCRPRLRLFRLAPLPAHHLAADHGGLRAGDGQPDNPDHQGFGVPDHHRGSRTHPRGERHPVHVFRSLCCLRERGRALLAIMPRR
jgi:His/Glu/Gln/Arg/opine family amino acid ABC transporter permease subunit